MKTQVLLRRGRRVSRVVTGVIDLGVGDDEVLPRLERWVNFSSVSRLARDCPDLTITKAIS